MADCDLTIRLYGRREGDVRDAVEKLRLWLLDGGGFEAVEGILLLDNGAGVFQLGDSRAPPPCGVTWEVWRSGPGSPTGYYLAAGSLSIGGRGYKAGAKVTPAVWAAFPSHVRGLFLPYWVGA